MQTEYIIDESKYTFTTMNVWPLTYGPETEGHYLGIGPHGIDNASTMIILEFLDGKWFTVRPSNVNGLTSTAAFTIPDEDFGKYFWTNKIATIGK